VDTDTAMYIGIDVAKATPDIAARPDAEQWVATDEDSIAVLAERTRATARSRRFGSDRRARAARGSGLAMASFAVAVVNPRQVRDVARTVGQLTKTNAPDAQLLAHFAEVCTLRRDRSPTPGPRD